MIRIFKEIWQDLFTNRNDIYPVKKPKHDEKAISKATGAKDIVPTEPGATDYTEIIDDYPTYHRHK